VQNSQKNNFFFLVTLLFLQTAGCDIDNSENKSLTVLEAGTFATCGFNEAVETDGYRRLALVVGVGRYKNKNVPDLEGPPNDANRFYGLLTEENGYGFPAANVCLLLNEEATTANFRQAFDKGLVERVRPNDVAVIFFAGHGSQASDKDGDEVDGFDETLMFHDARTGKVLDLVESAKGTVNESLPGMVVLSAAADNNPALEKNGRGIFTDALLQVMMGVAEQPLTYAQVERQAPPLVSAESPQVPYFHGDLDRAVFGNQSRTRPVSWEVKGVGPPIEIAGPPLAGVGEGAEFRIYDGSITGADTWDPNKAKATVVTIESTELNAKTQGAALLVIHKPGDTPVGTGAKLRIQ
jgi:hypothetical protein